MSGETTQDLNGNRNFEERVFARFDGIESYLRSLDGRVQVLESRSHDTKPIWERALKAILETGLEVGEVKSKVGIIENKVAVIETEVAGVKTEVVGLKSEVAGMKSDYAGIKNEVIDMKRQLKYNVKQQLNLILKYLLEDRDDIRDAEERINQLETIVGIQPDQS